MNVAVCFDVPTKPDCPIVTNLQRLPAPLGSWDVLAQKSFVQSTVDRDELSSSLAQALTD